jgi:hypothetical protein
VRWLVIVSVPYKRKGCYPEVLADFERLGPAPNLCGIRRLASSIRTSIGRFFLPKLHDPDWWKTVTVVEVPTMLVFTDTHAVHGAHRRIFPTARAGTRDARLDGSGRPRAWLATCAGSPHYNVACFLHRLGSRSSS